MQCCDGSGDTRADLRETGWAVPANPTTRRAVADALADISLLQLVLVAVTALFASVVGGVAGCGTGALMPLVLVPMVGAAPVVPVIAISALFTNVSRAIAFYRFVDGRRALLVTFIAGFTCVVGAYGYTLLNNRGALIVIGAMLALSVPLRRILKARSATLGDTGLGVSAAGYGLLTGGTTGSGVILVSLLLAAGLEGAAVVATDAVISIAMAVVKISMFGFSGIITPQVIALALLIGVIAFPGAFLAKLLVEHLPVKVHTAMLDAVVVIGALAMIAQAVRS